MREYKFKNASEAFDFYYGIIPYEGHKFDNTKAMFNQGFTIENPTDRIITNEARNLMLNMLKLNGNGIYQAIEV